MRKSIVDIFPLLAAELGLEFFNKNILETIVSQALAGATGAMVPAAFDDDDDDDLDFLDDPLGIAVPWEERFKKRGSAPAKPGPDAERIPGPGDSGGFKPTEES